MISNAHLAFLSPRDTLVALTEIKMVYYDLFKEE